MGRLDGKRVLITGTGGGQGAAAQRLFCGEGAAVVGCDVKDGAAEATAEALRAEGQQAWGRTVDLADPEAARAWVEWGAEELGGIDVLYNNASATALAPFGEMTLEEWRFTIVNELDILFYTTSPAWPHLERSRGSIINTASVCATIGEKTLGFAAHAAAKGGVLAFTRQLAAEGAPLGIRANAISPGFIASPATEVVPPEYRKRVVERLHMLDREGTPEDIAPIALYLASDESAFATGANFVVDGGWTSGGA
jgi:meso-butanediol dehydrogenase/(S,S)-butanediol dehydrogenase/diacetyl reductase